MSRYAEVQATASVHPLEHEELPCRVTQVKDGETSGRTFCGIVLGPVTYYIGVENWGLIRGMVKALEEAEGWLRAQAAPAVACAPCPVQYICPGDPEDGGEHVWVLEGEHQEERVAGDGGRVWCPDHEEKRREA